MTVDRPRLAGESQPGGRLLVAAGVAAALVAGTLVAHWRTVLHPDAPKAAPGRAWAVYASTVRWDDTEQYAWHLEQSADALRAGRLYMPISDYDCPVSFLAPGGLVRLATGWPAVRVINLFGAAVTLLSGAAAFVLFRRLGAAVAPAAVAAVAYQTTNFVVYSQQQGHMNNIQLMWLPWAFASLLSLLREPTRWRPAVWLGLAMGGQLLASPALSLYAAYVGLPVFALAYLLAAGGTVRTVGRLAVRGLLAVTVALAVAAVYLGPRLASAPRHYPRPLSDAHAFVLLDPALLVDSAHPMLFLGWPLLIVGLFALRWWSVNRTPELTAVVAAAAAAFVMLFPARFGLPYWAMWRFAPMVDRLRVPARFFPLFVLLLLGLISVYLTRRWAAPWKPAAALLAALAVGNWLSSPWVVEFDFYVALDGVGRRVQWLTGLDLGVA